MSRTPTPCRIKLPNVKHVVYIRHNLLRRVLLYSTSQNDVAKMLTQHSEAVCSCCLYQCTVTGLGGSSKKGKAIVLDWHLSDTRVQMHNIIGERE